MRKIVDKKSVKKLSDAKLEELKKNATDILCNCRRKMMMTQPFVGTIAMSLDLIPVRDIRVSTACTDGNNIYFDIDFLSSLTPDEQTFVFAHEVWHNVMCHFSRKLSRDASIFNIATDLEINQLLVKDGFTLPKEVCMPNTVSETYNVVIPEDKSAEDYYEILINAQQKNNQKNSSESKDGADGSDGNGESRSNKGVKGQFDKHIYEGDFSECGEDNGQGDGKVIADKYGEVGFDKDFNPSIDKDAKEKMRSRVISAAQQVQRTRGQLPGHIKGLVDQLLEPQINWQEVLAQFITRGIGDKREWNPPNRRHIWHDSYMQRRRGTKVRVAIGIDTSGSCVEDQTRFLSEINGIVKQFSNYELTLICCDTDIQKVDKFDEMNELNPETDKYEFAGGGGTTLSPIFKYVEENNIEFDSMVVFTDGYCETFSQKDTPGYPVLWVVTPGGTHETLGFGEIVDLKK
jgi:predicted metal-dependent peptidase